MRLDRVSEERGEFGGITADGMINVLGRPRLDVLNLVLREAAQNSWDARVRQQPGEPTRVPEFLVRVRTLADREEATLRTSLSEPASRAERPSRNELLAQLERPDPIRVLELCDFNTVGLGGPVGRSEPADGPDNFRKFFFDLGVEHVESGDGGTYGFGRSALYLVSRARTILVDSLAETRGGLERRLMACRIGHAHESRDFTNSVAVRYTGRHFWGRSILEGGVRPITGENAVSLATALGLPLRDRSSTGTSIMILWPDAEARMVQGRELWDSLLHHLWPKLVSSDGPLAMRIGVEEEGRRLDTPDLRLHPVYGLFSSALLAARDRTGRTGSRPIELQRPEIVTGHLGLEVGSAVDGESGVDPDIDEQAGDFAGGVRHVALMRPSELVVRYLEVQNARGDGRQWAGAFICVDDADVRNAFAASEPPAHDDWIPDRLDDRRARTLVRQTVHKYIPQLVRDAYAGTYAPVESDAHLGSLAAAADAFSRGFLKGDGTAPAPRDRETGGQGKPGARKLQGPVFEALAFESELRVASYRVRVRGIEPPGARLRAVAMIASDGSLEKDVPRGLLEPLILGWRESRSSTRVQGSTLVVVGDQEYLLDVAFRGEYGIVVSCRLEDGS